MGYQFATVALGPILYAQGKHVLRTVPKLSEPPGERLGESGSGTKQRLLLIGDSSAAGVGASTQDDALLGRMVNQLSRSCRLHWQLIARTGAKTPNIIKSLQRLETQPFDVVVTALGVNDVTGGHSRKEWKANQGALIDLLRSKFSARTIILSGLPPVSKFPALPQPLRWYLGKKADVFNDDLRLVAEEKECEYIALNVPGDASLMAVDGFHPGPEIYARWADLLIKKIESTLGSVDS